VDTLQPFNSEHKQLAGYLHQEDMLFINEPSIPFKDVAKVIQLPGLDMARTIIIDHRFPSLFFAKSNAFPVFDYIASDDNEHTEDSLNVAEQYLRK
jgi:hypothetical protein